jgi:hypothetical protein
MAINSEISIDTYRSKLLGSNARSYMFMCKIEFPGVQNVLKSGVMSGLAKGDIGNSLNNAVESAGKSLIGNFGLSQGTNDFKYYVKSTNLPESSVEEINTYWFGQQYKLSSVRRTSDWNVTFLIDHNADVLKKFWQWHLLIHNPESNMYGSPVDYMTNQVIQLLGADGNPTCTYKLFNAWPKTIGDVQLDYSNNDIAQVDITFCYQYLVVTDTEENGIIDTGRQALRGVGFSGLKNAVTQFMK